MVMVLDLQVLVLTHSVATMKSEVKTAQKQGARHSILCSRKDREEHGCVGAEAVTGRVSFWGGAWCQWHRRGMS